MGDVVHVEELKAQKKGIIKAIGKGINQGGKGRSRIEQLEWDRMCAFNDTD